MGRVLLDGPVPEVRVEILDTTGGLIHSFTTDQRGWFQKRGTVPPDFTLLAYVGDDTYRREVRGGWPRGTLYISTGTTLLSAYARTHADLSLDAAEQKLLAALDLPSQFKMSWVGQVKAENFSEAEFLQGVEAAGSLDAYLEKRIVELDQVIAAELVEDAAKFARGLAKETASSIYGSSVTTAVGDSVGNMGFNFTTASALSSISNQIDQVSTELTDLENSLTAVYNDAKLSALLAPLNTAGQTVDTTINDIKTTADAYRTSHPSNSDYNVPEATTNSQVVTTRANLLNLNIKQTVAPIVALQDGSVQSALYQAKAEPGTANIQNNQQYLSFPWRSNTAIRDAQSLLSQNQGRLFQAYELLSESAYASNPSQRATEIVQTLDQIDEWNRSIQTANSYVPDLLASDDVFYDAASGLLWANEFFAAKTAEDAASAVRNLTFGPYGTTTPFALPNLGDIEGLVRYRVAGQISEISSAAFNNNTWGDVDTSDWISAFQSLGFDTTYYDNVDNSGPGSDNNEGSWIQEYNGTNFFTWNNDGTNPDFDSYTGNDTCSYLARAVIFDYTDTQTVAPQVALNTEPGVLSQWAAGIFSGDRSVYKVAQQGSPNEFGGVMMTMTAKFFNNTNFVVEGANSYVAGGHDYDVTNRAVWSTSNSQLATISNFATDEIPPPLPNNGLAPANGDGSAIPPRPAGFLTWHPPILPSDPPLGPVEVTGTIQGASLSGNWDQFSATTTIQPPAGLTAQVGSVNFLPRNFQQQVNVSGPHPLVDFYATVFFQDGRVLDLSTDPNTTWELLDSGGNVISDMTQGGFGVATNSNKNQLLLLPGLVDLNPTIRVTYDSPFGTVSDSGQISVVIIP